MPFVLDLSNFPEYFCQNKSFITGLEFQCFLLQGIKVQVSKNTTIPLMLVNGSSKDFKFLNTN